MLEITITGIDKIDKKLASLPEKTLKKLAKKAVRTALKPIQIAAKAKAPKDTGELRKNIKVRAMTRLRDKKATIGVQVIAGQDFTGPTFHGGFQEFGWKAGKRTAGIKRAQKKKIAVISDSRRQIPGKHFVEDAYMHGREEVVETFKVEMVKAMDDVIDGL